MLILTWQKQNFPIFGGGYELAGLPCHADNAQVRRDGDGKRYIAHGFIGGRYVMVKAGTLHAAKQRFQSRIDRQSIGLLGVDDLKFQEE